MDSFNNNGNNNNNNNATSSSSTLVPISLTNSGGSDTRGNQFRVRHRVMVWELIGYELESNIDVRSGSGGLTYQDRVYVAEGGSWWIALDGVAEDGRSAVLELVVRAKMTWEELEPAFVQIAQFLELARAELLLSGVLQMALPELLARCTTGGEIKVKGSTAVVSIERKGEESFLLAPQVTMGAPLASLADVLLHAGQFRLNEFEEQENAGEAELERLLSNRSNRTNMRRVAQVALLNWDTLSTNQQEDALDALQNGQVLGEKARQRAIKALGKDAPRYYLFDSRSLPVVRRAVEWGEEQKKNKRKDVLSEDIDKAVGLMAMILRYLEDGFYAPSVQPYAKGIFRVMMRTNFAAMFRALGTARELFVASIAGIVGEWAQEDFTRRLVLRNGFSDAGLLKEVLKKVKRNAMQLHGALPYTGIVDQINPLTISFHGPTIGEWLASIIDPSSATASFHAVVDEWIREIYQGEPAIAKCITGLSGKDLMSRSVVAYNSISLGLFDVKTIGGVDFVVFEFREWPKFSISMDRALRMCHRLWAFFAEYCGGVAEEFEVDLSLVEEIGLGQFARNGFLSTLRLRRQGRPTSTPGECLFDSFLASGLFPLETAQTLRSALANELRTNWHHYIDYIATDVEGGDDIMAIIANAANYLAQPGNWQEDVADLAPVALANAMNATILVQNDSTGTTEVVGPSSATNVVVVRYNGIDHYTPGT